MRKGSHVVLAAVGLSLASIAADAEWFRHQSEPKPLAIQIVDDAYVGRPTGTGRLIVDGKHRIGRVVPSADKSIIRFDFDYAEDRGYLDELQHGLVKPQQSPRTAQLAYDRTTGLIVFQTISKDLDRTAAAGRTGSALRDNTETFLIAQPKDPAILEFLDAAIDHLDALDKYYQKRGDCGEAGAAKRLLPLQQLSAALPMERVLYARNLNPPGDCGAAWQQIQFAFNSIFELVNPLNPGSGGYGREGMVPVLPNSHIGDLDDATRAKMVVMAKSNEFREINYDLAAGVRELELSPHFEGLMVKKRQEVNLNTPGYVRVPVPTVLNIQDVLVELRSEKFKAYLRLAPAAAGS